MRVVREERGGAKSILSLADGGQCAKRDVVAAQPVAIARRRGPNGARVKLDNFFTIGVPGRFIPGRDRYNALARRWAARWADGFLPQKGDARCKLE